LRLFRIAYGRAGSEENLSVKDARQVAEQYLADTKISLQWPDELAESKLLQQRGFLKLLLNLLVLAEEALAYGGVVTLRDIKEAEGVKAGVRLEIVGRNASLPPKAKEALEGAVR